MATSFSFDPCSLGQWIRERTNQSIRFPIKPGKGHPLNVLLPISIRVELARHCRSDDSTVAGNLLLSKAIGNPFYYYFLCHFEAVSASISFRLLALVVVMLMPFPFLPPVALLPSRKEGFDAKTGFDASRVLEKLCALCECYLY